MLIGIQQFAKHLLKPLKLTHTSSWPNLHKKWGPKLRQKEKSIFSSEKTKPDHKLLKTSYFIKISCFGWVMNLNGLLQKKSKQEGEGLTDWGYSYLFQPLLPSGIFHFFTLPLQIPDKTKLNPWIFHKIVLAAYILWKFQGKKQRPLEISAIALSYPLPYCYWWLIMKKPGWKLFRSPNPNPRGVRKCNNFEAFLKSVGLFFYFLRGGLSHNWWGVVFSRGPEDFQLESLNQSSHILWD